MIVHGRRFDFVIGTVVLSLRPSKVLPDCIRSQVASFCKPRGSLFFLKRDLTVLTALSAAPLPCG